MEKVTSVILLTASNLTTYNSSLRLNGFRLPSIVTLSFAANTLGIITPIIAATAIAMMNVDFNNFHHSFRT